MVKKLSPQEKKVMRTLIIDNGSQYITDVENQINAAAETLEVGDHRIERKGVREIKDMYDGDKAAFAKYIGSFDYIISSGSKDLREYDKEVHGKISEHAKGKVVLGVCHGAQQLARAHVQN